MQYPHTRIVWVYTQDVYSHITIQEMNAVRLPSCFENCQIFYLGLRKHFLYVCNPTDCVTKLKTYSKTDKKKSEKKNLAQFSVFKYKNLVCSQLEHNLIAVQLAFVQQNRREIGLIDCVRVYLALDSHTCIILVATARLGNRATAR